MIMWCNIVLLPNTITKLDTHSCQSVIIPILICVKVAGTSSLIAFSLGLTHPLISRLTSLCTCITLSQFNMLNLYWVGLTPYYLLAWHCNCTGTTFYYAGMLPYPFWQSRVLSIGMTLTVLVWHCTMLGCYHNCFGRTMCNLLAWHCTRIGMTLSILVWHLIYWCDTISGGIGLTSIGMTLHKYWLDIVLSIAVTLFK